MVIGEAPIIALLVDSKFGMKSSLLDLGLCILLLEDILPSGWVDRAKVQSGRLALPNLGISYFCHPRKACRAFRSPEEIPA